jgi:hypothetical protein
MARCREHMWKLNALRYGVYISSLILMRCLNLNLTFYKMYFFKLYYATFNLDYWDFGLCPSSGTINNTKEHNISESESVSVLRRGEDTLLGPSERANLNKSSD